MKKYLVKLNRPILIEYESYPSRYKTIFGFLARFDEDKEKNKKNIHNIDCYVKYLCALAEWTSGSGEFRLADNLMWVDKNGKNHLDNSKWALELGARCREKLGLSYTLHMIDLDEIPDENETIYHKDIEKDNIFSQGCMDYLLNVAESQKEPRKEYYAMLYNRPIWMKKELIWPGEDGFCLIYGTVAPINVYKDRCRDSNGYLGYLSAIQEYILNDETPSGYTYNVDNDKKGEWYDEEGKAHNICSTEMIEEYCVCQKMNGLRAHEAFIYTPDQEINQYVKDCFILSLDYYEKLVKAFEDTDDDD